MRRVNFFYGANGAGKSTVSKIIASPADYPACEVVADATSALEVRRYSAEFVRKNIEASPELPGVFTMGEDKIGTQQELTRLQGEGEKARVEAEDLAEKRAQVVEKQTKLQRLFELACWNRKPARHTQIGGLLSGVHGSKGKYVAELLSPAAEEEGDAEVATRGVLEEQLKRLADDRVGPRPIAAAIDGSALSSVEADELFGTVVARSDAQPLGLLLEQLGHQGWVRDGLSHLAHSPGTCPLCQQPVSEQLEAALRGLFNATYEAAEKQANTLKAAYGKAVDIVVIEVAEVTRMGLAGRAQRLEELGQNLLLVLRENLRQLGVKCGDLSRRVELAPSTEPLAAFNLELALANSDSEEHNRLIADRGAARERLKVEVWRTLRAELGAASELYRSQWKELEDEASATTASAKTLKSRRTELAAEIGDLQGRLTSTVATLNSINSYLDSFGFTGFRLSAVDGGAVYRIERDGGEAAHDSLSEGEKTLVAFLYFVAQLEGGTSKKHLATDLAVVFDDPVSSLDAESLFLVGRIVRRLANQVRKGEGRVKQLFVFTHNLRFHREATYRVSGQAKVAYYVVRKRSGVSEVERTGHKNPIRSDYDELWREIRKEQGDPVTVRNCMRRALETYFTLIGDKALGDVVDEQHFDPADREVFHSLVNWMHAGSHASLFVVQAPVTQQQIDRYRLVFSRLFEMADQGGHYRMMMEGGAVDG